MLSIDKNYGNPYGPMFTIKVKEPGFGRGWKVTANSSDEVKLAIDHYYGPTHGNIDIDECPLCQYASRQQQKATNR